MVKRGPENAHVKSLIISLSKSKAGAYLRLAEILSSARRRRPAVNLYKLDKNVAEGSVVAVPGKILGIGKVTKKFTIAALEYSDSAAAALAKAGVKAISLNDLLAQNPQGKAVKIIV